MTVPELPGFEKRESELGRPVYTQRTPFPCMLYCAIPERSGAHDPNTTYARIQTRARELSDAELTFPAESSLDLTIYLLPHELRRKVEEGSEFYRDELTSIANALPSTSLAINAGLISKQAVIDETRRRGKDNISADWYQQQFRANVNNLGGSWMTYMPITGETFGSEIHTLPMYMWQVKPEQQRAHLGDVLNLCYKTFQGEAHHSLSEQSLDQHAANMVTALTAKHSMPVSAVYNAETAFLVELARILSGFEAPPTQRDFDPEILEIILKDIDRPWWKCC